MSATTSSESSSSEQAQGVPYKELGKRFYNEFREDDVMGLAAEVAYHLIFAIPPLLVLIVTVAAALNRFTQMPVVENLRQLVDERAPENLHDVLNTIITSAVGQVSGGLISVGLLTTAAVAIWSGSNGIASVMKAYNRAYDVKEGRSYVKKRLVAVGLTLLMVVLVNAAFALFVFGASIGEWVANWLGLGDQFRMLWEVARWPAAFMLFMFLLAVLYYLAPNAEQSFRWISPGSVTATILWVIAVFGFRLYLQFTDPGSAYGAFSSVIVFLFFLYVTSIVLLIGAEINGVLQRRYDEKAVRYRAAHPERLESHEARERAAGEASEFEQRSGKGVDNRAAEEVAVKREPERSSRPGSVDGPRRTIAHAATLAVVGTTVGWLLGHRSGKRTKAQPGSERRA